MSLEAHRAGLALFWMVAWAVVAAVCIITTWMGLMAALAMWAVSVGLLPIAAVILVAILNLVAGAVLIRVCVGLSRGLLFPRRAGSWHAIPPPRYPSHEARANPGSDRCGRSETGGVPAEDPGRLAPRTRRVARNPDAAFDGRAGPALRAWRAWPACGSHGARDEGERSFPDGRGCCPDRVRRTVRAVCSRATERKRCRCSWRRCERRGMRARGGCCRGVEQFDSGSAPDRWPLDTARPLHQWRLRRHDAQSKS